MFIAGGAFDGINYFKTTEPPSGLVINFKKA
jgi:hypothetical protein